MGLTTEIFAFLCQAHSQGTSFERVATIGRQTNYVDIARTKTFLPDFPFVVDGVSYDSEYSEELLAVVLGAKKVDVIDYSDYEGANIVLDMNLPVPRSLLGNYDVVINGGSLEHIFNLPMALMNCMKMLREGGSLFSFSPANNAMGHGFYQFSPELFYRTLVPKYGFELKRMIAVEHPFAAAECGSSHRLFVVNDPALAGRRVTLVNSKPVGLMVHAVRHEVRPVDFLSDPPQQVDYEVLWRGLDDLCGQDISKEHGFGKVFRRMVSSVFWGCFSRLPVCFRNLLLPYYERRVHSFRNKRFYTRIRFPSMLQRIQSTDGSQNSVCVTRVSAKPGFRS